MATKLETRPNQVNLSQEMALRAGSPTIKARDLPVKQAVVGRIKRG